MRPYIFYGGMIEWHGRPKGAPTKFSGEMIERRGRTECAHTEIDSRSLFGDSRAHGMRPYGNALMLLTFFRNML